MRTDCRTKCVIAGKAEGKKEGKRRRGTRREQLLGDLKEKKRYWTLKETALRHSLWRTTFELAINELPSHLRLSLEVGLLSASVQHANMYKPLRSATCVTCHSY